MALVNLQGDAERREGIYYQYDTALPPIGQGGMGVVMQGVCIDVQTGSTRPVAIKLMNDGLPQNAYERARREASIRLRNDNLVEMLGFIETREQNEYGEVRHQYYVISELLTGVSLSDVLDGKTKDRNGEDVSFAVKMLQDYKNDPERFAVRIATSVLSGVMALHDAGYIHRDIDPSNIMLTSDGHIKLIDFGIAKQMHSLTTGDKSLTVSGKFMGKPEYAAPELVLGDINHQNQTTDIYAIGILLYQCILGHTPFEGARYEIAEKQLHAKMPLDKIKNKSLRRIIATACQKKQELRYQTSAQMRVALETMGKSNPLFQHTKLMALAACGVLVLVLGISILVVKQKKDKAREIAQTALAEQQHQQLTQQIEDNIARGDHLFAEGRDKENDNYEQKLMEAYSAYEAAEKTAKSARLSSATATQKKQQVLAELSSASQELESQAVTLNEIGETQMAETFMQRAKNTASFIQQVSGKSQQSKPVTSPDSLNNKHDDPKH